MIVDLLKFQVLWQQQVPVVEEVVVVMVMDGDVVPLIRHMDQVCH